MVARASAYLLVLLVGLLVGMEIELPPPPASEVSQSVLPAGRWFGEPMERWGEAAPSATPRVQLSDAQVRPGDALWISVEGARGASSFSLDTDLSLWEGCLNPLEKGGAGFLAVDYRTDPGTYSVEVAVSWDSGRVWREVLEMQVVEYEFPVQRLTVSPSLLAVRSPERARQDRIHLDRALSESHPLPLWEGPFIMPTEGRLTTEFGVIRYINEVESGRHSGLDIAAPTGTPVVAAARGRVVLAEDLYVLGKTVIVDHGLNLFSWYYHLHEVGVEEGQMVEKGEKIGEVGSTGFSTGPHLHWSVSLERTYISPWLMMDRAFGPGLD